MTIKKVKSIRLYSWDGDSTTWWRSDKDSIKKAEKDQKSAKKLEGKSVKNCHPTNSIQSYTTLYKAKNAARKSNKHWYFLTEFDVPIDTIIRAFDGEFGSNGMPCVVKKVHKVVEIK